MTNIELIKQCYEYFRRGDGPRLLALFDPQIEFRLAEGHPYRMDGKPWVGPAEIAEQFLMNAGPEWENWNIIISDILETKDAVIVEDVMPGRTNPRAGAWMSKSVTFGGLPAKR